MEYFETVEPKKVSQVLEKKYSVCTVRTVCTVCSLRGLRFGVTPCIYPTWGGGGGRGRAAMLLPI